MSFLPKLLATITRAPRDKVDIVWSNASWTHNVFRLWELIFWRRSGIRIEETTIFNSNGENGLPEVVHVAYSFEALCALAETYVRDFLSSLKLKPVRVYSTSALASSGYNLQFPGMLLAVALDASTGYDGGATTTATQTFSKTCTGSNLVLVLGVETTPSSGSTPRNVSSSSYNSVALTLAKRADPGGAAYFESEIWRLVNPATGSNTVSITLNGTGYIVSQASSFSGADTASPIGATASYVALGNTPLSLSITTDRDNSWLIDAVIVNHNPGGITKGASQTLLNSAYNSSFGFNGGGSYQITTTAGSYTTAWTANTANDTVVDAVVELHKAAAVATAKPGILFMLT